MFVPSFALSGSTQHRQNRTGGISGKSWNHQFVILQRETSVVRCDAAVLPLPPANDPLPFRDGIVGSRLSTPDRATRVCSRARTLSGRLWYPQRHDVFPHWLVEIETGFYFQNFRQDRSCLFLELAANEPGQEKSVVCLVGIFGSGAATAAVDTQWGKTEFFRNPAPKS